MEEKFNYHQTMWAEMKPDCYGGDTCEEILPRWQTYAEGDMESDTINDIRLSARTFPPGTRVTVKEPLCPQCNNLRSPVFPYPEHGSHYAGPCNCGFDWDAWVIDQYS